MNEMNTAEEIGKAIIIRLHEQNKIEGMDDAEYIPLIKRIIEAITIHMSKGTTHSTECDTLNKTLLAFSRELYIELCQEHAKENEESITMLEVKKESEEYFNYIYEHEEHPC